MIVDQRQQQVTQVFLGENGTKKFIQKVSIISIRKWEGGIIDERERLGRLGVRNAPASVMFRS